MIPKLNTDVMICDPSTYSKSQNLNNIITHFSLFTLLARVCPLIVFIYVCCTFRDPLALQARQK